MPAEMTEADLLRRIARAQKKQDAAEDEEARIYGEGGPERAAATARRNATRALWTRRKLTKQLDDLRAQQAEVPRG